MHGRASCDLQADCTNLSVAAVVASKPYSCPAFNAFHGKSPFFAQSLKDAIFDAANPCVQIDWLAKAHNRVDNDLSGAMPCRGTRTIDVDDGQR